MNNGAEFQLDIVAHSYRYSRLLAYQLSSLCLHPPERARVNVVVFHTADDPETCETLDWFGRQPLPPTVTLTTWQLEPPQLFRRAIGRNLACRASRADWLWLADCDYLFGPNCLDALPEQLAGVTGPLAYPRQTLRSISHELGDAAIERVVGPGIYAIPPAANFEPERNNRGIGGIQIYRGSVARERGYLDGHRKWLLPEERWARTREDAVFRGWVGAYRGRGEGIDVPNLYRIRHSRRGRVDIGVKL